MSKQRPRDIFDNPILRNALNAFAENVVDKAMLTDDEQQEAQATMGGYVITHINDSNVCLFVAAIYLHIYLHAISLDVKSVKNRTLLIFMQFEDSKQFYRGGTW